MIEVNIALAIAWAVTVVILVIVFMRGGVTTLTELLSPPAGSVHRIFAVILAVALAAACIRFVLRMAGISAYNLPLDTVMSVPFLVYLWYLTVLRFKTRGPV